MKNHTLPNCCKFLKKECKPTAQCSVNGSHDLKRVNSRFLIGNGKGSIANELHFQVGPSIDDVNGEKGVL